MAELEPPIPIPIPIPTTAVATISTDDNDNDANDNNDSGSLDLDDIFADPPDYYPPTPPPTSQTFTLACGRVLMLHLVGHSALEGHLLWNGSKAVSRFLEDHPHRVAGGNVLELGAGAGLPSLVCASLGAKAVVVTDYPDGELLGNMVRNVDLAGEVLWGGGRSGSGGRTKIRVRGYIWGRDTEPLLRLIQDDYDDEEGEEEDMSNIGDRYYNYHGLPPSPSQSPSHPTVTTTAPSSSSSSSSSPSSSSSSPSSSKPPPPQKFDAIIMTDLLFRHCEHANLLLTIRSVLRRSRTAAAYVFFTSHRPWLLHADLAFFELAQEEAHGGFVVEKVLERELETPLFEKRARRRRVCGGEVGEGNGEEDGEDGEVRETVTGWVVRWREGDWDEE